MKAATSELGLQGWDGILWSQDNRERTFQKEAAAQVKLKEHRAEVLNFSVHRVIWGACADSQIPAPKFWFCRSEGGQKFEGLRSTKMNLMQGFEDWDLGNADMSSCLFHLHRELAPSLSWSAESVLGASSPRPTQTFRGEPCVLDPSVVAPATSNPVLAASCSGRRIQPVVAQRWPSLCQQWVPQFGDRYGSQGQRALPNRIDSNKLRQSDQHPVELLL